MKHEFKEARLRQYADYLKHNNLKCERFYAQLTKNAEVIIKKEDDMAQRLFFLPMLEIPQIFKKDWYYNDNYMPICNDSKDRGTVSSIIEYFGINQEMFGHLFVVGQQNPDVYGGRWLSDSPTVKELIHNIEALIEQIRYYRVITENEYSILICLN